MAISSFSKITNPADGLRNMMEIKLQPPSSPDLNLTEHLWSVLEKQV